MTLACVLLAGCEDYDLGAALGRPEMTGALPGPAIPPPQDTPELQARAEAERETIPPIPPPHDTIGYPNLGTVPPKPVMPTVTEIENATNDLQAEQQKGAAMIADQAAAPEPQTLTTGPNGTVTAGTPPASPVAAQAVVTPPMGPFLSGAAGLQGPISPLMANDNRYDLPPSQTIEQPDMLAPDQR